MTKGGLWHYVISVRKERYDVIAVYFSFSATPELFKQWKINLSDEEWVKIYVLMTRVDIIFI